MPRNRVKSRHRAGGFVSRVEMRIVGVKEPSDPPPNQSCALGKVTLEPGHDTREKTGSTRFIATECNVSALRESMSSASSDFCLLLFSVCCLLYFGQIILGWNMPRTVDRMLAPARSWIPVTRAFPIQLPRALWVVGAAISVGHSAYDSSWLFLFSHDTLNWGLRVHEGSAAILDKMTGSRRSN